MTPCTEKPTACTSIILYGIQTKTKVSVSDSWECRKCFLLNFEVEAMSEFDHQDFIDLDLTNSINDVTGWSYPVDSVKMISSSWDTERWRIGFDRRSHLKNTKTSFSVKIKMKKKEPIVQSMSICPCGIFNVVPLSTTDSWLRK